MKNISSDEILESLKWSFKRLGWALETILPFLFYCLVIVIIGGSTLIFVVSAPQDLLVRLLVVLVFLLYIIQAMH